MRLKKIVRLFEDGNVCVCGLLGRGKDMLIANVVMRRNLGYISNIDYGGKRFEFIPRLLDCGGNTYRNFIEGDVRYYECPYEDGTDVYISDAALYFPSHYCNELNKLYGFFPTFMALTRQLMEGRVHFNVQNLNRCWDKIREQSDIYIMCNWCKVFFGKIVLQRVTYYESYDSAVKRVPAFWLPRPWFNPDRIFQWKIQKQNYEISHGRIESGLLLYVNKSNYDTRVFKEVLANGKKK